MGTGKSITFLYTVHCTPASQGTQLEKLFRTIHSLPSGVKLIILLANRYVVHFHVCKYPTKELVVKVGGKLFTIPMLICSVKVFCLSKYNFTIILFAFKYKSRSDSNNYLFKVSPFAWGLGTLELILLRPVRDAAIRESCTAKTKCRKFETNIPRKGISGPQCQFPHSCVCERIIYSHDGSAFSAGGNMRTDPGNI